MATYHGVLAIGAAALLTVSLVAQAPSQQTPQSPSTQRGQMMSMGDMMKGCQEHCRSMTTNIDHVTRAIDQAEASNDPAKMRSALDQAQKPLAQMKQHMTMCMNMMSMMEKMHGDGTNR